MKIHISGSGICFKKRFQELVLECDFQKLVSKSGFQDLIRAYITFFQSSIGSLEPFSENNDTAWQKYLK